MVPADWDSHPFQASRHKESCFVLFILHVLPCRSQAMVCSHLTHSPSQLYPPTQGHTPGQAITSVPVFSVASCPTVAPSRCTQAAAQTLPSLPDLEALISSPGPPLPGVAFRKPQMLIFSSALHPDFRQGGREDPGRLICGFKRATILPDNMALLQCPNAMLTGNQPQLSGHRPAITVYIH